jgi:hypothetical protein
MQAELAPDAAAAATPYAEVLAFVANLTGSTPSRLIGYELTGLDYAVALHALRPRAVDLRRFCWMARLTPHQDAENVAELARCVARVAEADGEEAAPSSLAPGELSLTTLAPSPSCFVTHLLLQHWLYRIGRRTAPTAAATAPDATVDAAAVAPAAAATSSSSSTTTSVAALASVAENSRRRHAAPRAAGQRCAADLFEAAELVVAEKAAYRQCWRDCERVMLAMLERDAAVDWHRLQNVVRACQPTRVV